MTEDRQNNLKWFTNAMAFIIVLATAALLGALVVWAWKAALS